VTERGGDADSSAPFLTTAYATGDPGSFPAARAVARALLAEDGRQRILLAVAAGVGDPPSAEAQALEALGRLEAETARARAGAPAEAILQRGFEAAADGVLRLKSLPGSVQQAGVVMVAALVEDGQATLAAIGSPAALLRRGNVVRRLTEPAVRGRRALGMGGPVEPAFAGPFALEPGDALVLCTRNVAGGLGEEVIEAVFEEFGTDAAAHDLADLAAQQPGSEGAAVALLALPGPRAAAGREKTRGTAAVADAPVVVAGSTKARTGGTPRWLTWLLLGAAIVAGVVAAVAIVAWQGGFGRSSNEKTAQQSAAGVAVVPSPSASPSVTPTVIAPPAAARSSPVASATRTATPAATPAPAATLAPLSSLPACDSAGPPCRYTARAGDSMSVIGDRFNITTACFAAVNRDHVGVPVTLPNPVIGLGEEYYIPSQAQCAALAAGATPTAEAANPAPDSATPRSACTPYPGASAPPPFC
jgi:hypothetical protein